MIFIQKKILKGLLDVLGIGFLHDFADFRFLNASSKEITSSDILKQMPSTR